MRYRSITAALLCLGLAGSDALLALTSATPSVQRSSRRSKTDVRPQGTDGREGLTPSPQANREKEINLIPQLEAADDYQLALWFKNCDPDASQWISFYEAKYALGFGRSLFRSFDENEDGRLVKEEFVAYYEHTIKRNQFRRPKIRNKPIPPERTPEQLMLAYDADLNSGISLTESTRLLNDYSRVKMDSRFLFTRVDLNHDQLLSVQELGLLSQAIRHLNLPQAQVVNPKARAPKNIDELFLRIIPSSNRLTPPTLIGPITTFRRLDMDGDGTISISDLEGLKRTVSTNIRVGTVLHTLDTNQDGVLSRSELRQSMEVPGQPPPSKDPR
ncbi:MAG: Ca2+-binding EF-hand superfamily protein [Glaciecola sp.]|jgi:Ca2+-binding EF-hand superfamily protein